MQLNLGHPAWRRSLLSDPGGARSLITKADKGHWGWGATVCIPLCLATALRATFLRGATAQATCMVMTACEMPAHGAPPHPVGPLQVAGGGRGSVPHGAVFSRSWWVCGPSLLYPSPSHIFASTGPKADGVRMPQGAMGGQGVWLELCSESTKKDRELGGGSQRAGHSPPCECALRRLPSPGPGGCAGEPCTSLGRL